MKRLFSNKLNILLTLMLILILAGLIVLAINLMGLGHKVIIAEDFSGKTVAQVSEWISEKELSEDRYTFTYEYDEEIPENQLIYQSVKAGEEIKENISFVFSKGKDPAKNTIKVNVPDFADYSEEDIRKWADDNKVSVNIDYSYSDTVTRGKVISQSAVSDVELRADEHID
ncbi:MAG: PASTA domain-containing protein, partial [Erysipelotrichaceae bacterium]|nr:PASTA domain-containing protein [Erysipelotrichaceae bacterium]